MATPLNASILKSFRILDLFSAQRTEITAADLVEELDMNLATARRFLLTLEKAGALRAKRRGCYTLGETIERVGAIAEATNPTAALLRPLIRKLSDRLDESVMVCRLGREGPTCVAVATADHPISVNINIGTVLPINAAQGLLWLSRMDPDARDKWLARMENRPTEDALRKVREQGFACNLGATGTGIGAIAVPLRGPGDRLSLTMSAFGLVERFSADRIPVILGHLRGAANDIHLD